MTGRSGRDSARRLISFSIDSLTKSVGDWFDASAAFFMSIATISGRRTLTVVVALETFFGARFMIPEFAVVYSVKTLKVIDSIEN